MSVTSTDTDAAVAAAAAVIRTLPAAGLTPGAAGQGPSALATAVIDADGKAVSATLAGDITGTLVLLLSADLATQIENGPIPQELVAGLTPSLDDAVAALGQTLGEVRHEAAQIVAADVALANADTFQSVTLVPLQGAAGVVASVVILINHTAGSTEQSPFQTLSATVGAASPVRGVELLNDVEMGITAELGRTRITVRELLSMQPGSIVELDRAAGSPVDLLVNGTLVARGEVVVIDEEFGVRITEIVGYDAKKGQGK